MVSTALTLRAAREYSFDTGARRHRDASVVQRIDRAKNRIDFATTQCAIGMCATFESSRLHGRIAPQLRRRLEQIFVSQTLRRGKLS
jgi:hypothetical protein